MDTQVQRTRAQWKGPQPTSVLCSAHFTSDDFEPSSSLSKSFGLESKLKLKSGAVPSIFKRKLEGSSMQPVCKKGRNAYKKRERKRVSLVP